MGSGTRAEESSPALHGDGYELGGKVYEAAGVIGEQSVDEPLRRLRAARPKRVRGKF